MIEVEPYRPEETGVGCAEHADPACLCDVRYDEPARILPSNEMMFSGVAFDLAGGFPHMTSAEYADWLGYMMALYELTAEARALEALASEARWVYLRPRIGPFEAVRMLLPHMPPERVAAELALTTKKVQWFGQYNKDCHVTRMDVPTYLLFDMQVRAETLGPRKIAKQFEIPETTVGSYRSMLGLRNLKAPPTEEHIARMRELRAAGMHATKVRVQINEEFNVSYSYRTVARYIAGHR